MAVERGAERSFYEVTQNLNQFSEIVALTRKGFSKLFSEVFHVPLDDGGSALKLKMFEKMFDDDFASHLEYLRKMCSALETALDQNPITLDKLKGKITTGYFNCKMALKEIDHIDSEVIKESVQQISDLKILVSKLKKLKEDQESAFEASGKEKKENEEIKDTKKAIMSKLKGFLAKEAKEALFKSELETNPETLLTHLEDVESRLQEACNFLGGYKEVLQTVIKRMTEVQEAESEDAIVKYISGMKDGAREIIQVCDKI